MGSVAKSRDFFREWAEHSKLELKLGADALNESPAVAECDSPEILSSSSPDSGDDIDARSSNADKKFNCW